MDDITARLESLFRRYGAAIDDPDVDGVRLGKQFYEEADLLIAQYGQAAIERALDEPGEALASNCLH
jgi:hypothetical protein